MGSVTFAGVTAASRAGAGAWGVAAAAVARLGRAALRRLGADWRPRSGRGERNDAAMRAGSLVSRQTYDYTLDMAGQLRFAPVTAGASLGRPPTVGLPATGKRPQGLERYLPEYGLMAMRSAHRGNAFAKLNNGNSAIARRRMKAGRQAQALGGLANCMALSRCSSYWSGGFLAEPGFTDRIKAMIFQRSSEVLTMPPKGGIGPTTTSFLTRW